MDNNEDNNEDTDELALYFDAKKENEELREKVSQLEKLKSMHKKQIGDLYIKNREMSVFINDLGRFPKFWARSYKKIISKFIIKQICKY